MVKYNFDQVVDRKGTNSIKWEYYRQYIGKAPDGALPLWVADMDFPCAEPIIKALHERVDRQIFGYSTHTSNQYMEAVTRWFERRFNWSIKKENLFISPGIVTAVAVLVRILAGAGQGILIQRPVYYPFTKKIEANNRVVVNNPLIYDDCYYRMDYEDLERKIAHKNTAAMILCSPHNPVGRVWKVDELIKVVEICRKYEKWIISDEIHADLVRNGISHYPLEVIAPDYREKIITLTSPSKTFNLPGLMLSNIVINSPTLQQAWSEEVSERLSVGMANPLSIKALEAAYNEGEEWLDQLRTYLDDNIAYAGQFFKEYLPQSKFVYPEGTYLLWIDLRGYCQDYRELEDLMLNKAGVVLDEGYFFGDEGKGFERINAACPRITLTKCLERMKMALSH